jgi:methyl-accepting chemotaxis protein
MHAKLGLTPGWYIGGYSYITASLVEAVVKDQWPSLLKRSKGNASSMAASLRALVKAVFLDMSLGIEAYRQVLDEEKALAEAARAAIEQEAASAISAMAKALQRLADGDLASRMDSEVAASFAALKSDFNSAVEKLEDTVSSVLATTHSLGSGVDEIAQSSDDLSKRTEQQAASLEETAAAMAEMTQSVQDTAAGAEKAAKSVANVKAGAAESNLVVKSAIDAMGEIESSSQKITQIIGVIDEIAFQTNLLALNAGVEAARAGEAGRGFAVVASEVRALAQRSAEAAKEIKTLIATSSDKVEAGVSLVRKSGEFLQLIISQVNETDGLVATIAAAAKQQALGLQEVNVAIAQMDQLTQQNAAMVEEATAATHTLKSEMTGLSDLVSNFKIHQVTGSAHHSSKGRGDTQRAASGR